MVLPSSDIGKSRLGSSRFTRTQFTCTTKPRTPMVNSQRPFLLGEPPIGKSAVRVLCDSYNMKPRTPKLRLRDTCLPLTPGSHDATSTSGFRGSRIRHGKFPWYRKPRNAEPRYPGSDATRPSVDRRFPLLREIATREFTGHGTLVSPNSERRNPI
jgi:hypothetical protein